MERIYIIKGLDCANCAREFEEKIKKINGVNKAMVNFMTLKLIVDLSSDCENEIFTIAKNFEDGLTLKRIK